MTLLRGRSRGMLLTLVALSAGALFFSTVSRLWPLIPGDLRESAHDWRSEAAALDHLIGTRLERYQMESRIRIDAGALDCLERTLGRDATGRLITEDELPLAWRRVTFKEAGNPDSVTVNVLLNGHLMGWERTVQEDAAGVEPADEPEEVAREAAQRLVQDLMPYRVIERDTKTMPNRFDRRWTFERTWDSTGSVPLRERIEVVLAGDRVVKAMRYLVVPGPAARQARERLAPIVRPGSARLRPLLAGDGCGCGGGALAPGPRRGQARTGSGADGDGGRAAGADVHVLQPAVYFELWDPLWPRWGCRSGGCSPST